MSGRDRISTPFGSFSRIQEGERLPVPPTPFSQRFRVAAPEALLSLIYLGALLFPGHAGFDTWLRNNVFLEFGSIIYTPIVTVLVVLERDVWTKRPVATFLQLTWFAFGFFVTGFLCDQVAGTAYMRYSGIITAFFRLAPVYWRPRAQPRTEPGAAPTEAEPRDPGLDLDGSYFSWKGEPATPLQIVRIKQMMAAGALSVSSIVFFVPAIIVIAASDGTPIHFGAAYFAYFAVMRGWIQGPIVEHEAATENR